MTPPSDRWQRIKQLFEGATALAPDARGPYLAEACAGDPTLEQELRSLLASNDEAGAFLERPALAGGLVVTEEAETGPRPRLGAYELREVVGTGGMGTVYAAVRADDQYEKRVAIKLMAAGLDTEAVRERFKRERQILAGLEHAGIARLLDGGATPEGQPYFVMEFVDGVRLDRYAAQQRLGLRARLELFLAVCAAVQHAHQNLVVHQDLKPSNILVTADGAPKLLDFGIAKLLDPEAAAEATVTSLRPMTPEYASPEQVRGAPVGTASDVYSLGVVLYELLAGQRPYRLAGRGPTDATRIILEEEPPRPSAAVTGDARLRRALEGDLDTIVLKALRKEPARRYPSVEALAGDIGRHLAGLPVLARPDTFTYRAGKLVRRNVVAVSLSALVVAALAGGMVATAWQARRAEAERARAQRRFEEVRSLAGRILFDLYDGVEALPGSTAARARIVQESLAYLDRLSREAAGDPVLQRELAAAYRRLGEVQGREGGSSLGDDTAALASYGKARDLQEAALRAAPEDAPAQLELARTCVRLGDTLIRTGDVTGAVRAFERAVALGERVVQRGPAGPEARRGLLNAYTSLAWGQELLGDTRGVVESGRKAVALSEPAARAPAADPLSREMLAAAHRTLAGGLRLTGDLEGARVAFEQAAVLTDAVAAEDPGNARRTRAAGFSHERLGLVRLDLGDAAGALRDLQQTLSAYEAVAAADPSDAEIQRDLAVVHGMIGGALLVQGASREARLALERSLRLSEALAVANPANLDHLTDAACTHQSLGRLHEKAGDRASALRSHRQAAAILERLVAANPERQPTRLLLGLAYAALGRVEGEAAACDWHRKARDLFRDLRARGALALEHRAEVERADREAGRCEARPRPLA